MRRAAPSLDKEAMHFPSTSLNLFSWMQLTNYADFYRMDILRGAVVECAITLLYTYVSVSSVLTELGMEVIAVLHAALA
jgi:hypothetical protein